MWKMAGSAQREPGSSGFRRADGLLVVRGPGEPLRVGVDLAHPADHVPGVAAPVEMHARVVAAGVRVRFVALERGAERGRAVHAIGEVGAARRVEPAALGRMVGFVRDLAQHDDGIGPGDGFDLVGVRLRGRSPVPASVW